MVVDVLDESNVAELLPAELVLYCLIIKFAFFHFISLS